MILGEEIQCGEYAESCVACRKCLDKVLFVPEANLVYNPPGRVIPRRQRNLRMLAM